MIETSTATIGLLEEDLICVRFKPNTYLEIEDLAENRKAIFELIQDRMVYVLSVPYNDTLISPEFRETFVKKPVQDFKKAEAIVITTLPQKLLARFLKRVQKVDYPLEFFDTEEQAMSWLENLKAHEKQLLEKDKTKI